VACYSVSGVAALSIGAILVLLRFQTVLLLLPPLLLPLLLVLLLLVLLLVLLLLPLHLLVVGYSAWRVQYSGTSTVAAAAAAAALNSLAAACCLLAANWQQPAALAAPDGLLWDCCGCNPAAAPVVSPIAHKDLCALWQVPKCPEEHPVNSLHAVIPAAQHVSKAGQAVLRVLEDDGWLLRSVLV
jgi:hypothetical protein